MNKVKKIVVLIAIILATVVMVALWNSPYGAVKTSIEDVNELQKTTKEPFVLTTIEKDTTEEVTELSFNSVDDAKAYVKKYAKQKGYKLKDYPEKLFELMVKDKTSIDYVLDYPSEINKKHDSTLELDSFDSVPLLIQWDTRWGYHQFKNGIVGIDGCGATCLSMAAIYLNKDVTLTPDVIADYAADNGYFVDGSGTSWSMFDKGVKHYGLKSKTISIKKESLVDAVENGHPVVLSVREGDFTRKGHYIVVAGYKNNKFIINDPFSEVNSAKRWSWSRIKPQIKNMWELYK